jgi:drug/metabolite transporter (DMT)-like permease
MAAEAKTVAMSTSLKLLATMALWGGTFVAGRNLAGVVPPFAAAFWRFVLAGSLLLLLLRRAEGGLPPLDRRQLGLVFLLGLTGVCLYNAFFFTGLQTVPASRAALIIALNPVAIALLAALVGGEPLHARRSLGVLIAVTGAALVISSGRLGTLLTGGISLGDLALLGCVVCWALYSVLGRQAMRSLAPLTAVTYSALAGALLLMPFGIAQGALSLPLGYGPAAWGSLLYLAVGGTVIGFIWYYQAIHEIGTVRAGVFINFVPIFGVLLGFLLLGEPLTPALLVGGPLVIAGAWLANAGSSASRPAPAVGEPEEAG